MEKRTLNIRAHNFPEVEEILNKKFYINNILNKERKFIKFEGKNFVYKYKMVVVIRKQPIICEECGFNIEGKIAWWQGKKVCQFCYKTKTKGYNKG